MRNYILILFTFLMLGNYAQENSKFRLDGIYYTKMEHRHQSIYRFYADGTVINNLVPTLTDSTIATLNTWFNKDIMSPSIGRGKYTTSYDQIIFNIKWESKPDKNHQYNSNIDHKGKIIDTKTISLHLSGEVSGVEFGKISKRDYSSDIIIYFMKIE